MRLNITDPSSQWVSYSIGAFQGHPDRKIRQPPIWLLDAEPPMALRWHLHHRQSSSYHTVLKLFVTNRVNN